jgi:two-component system chemotaxis response regulator CheB
MDFMDRFRAAMGEPPRGQRASGTRSSHVPNQSFTGAMQKSPGTGNEESCAVVAIGASAGGVKALQDFVRHLPRTLNAAVLIVLHTTPSNSGYLDRILQRNTEMPVAYVRGEDEPLRHGRIYLAPPDHHLILGGTYVRIIHGPRENRHRPAIDPLFRSAAIYFGPRAIGVVLSGCLDDGTSGLIAIKQCGGTSIVQDPKEALFPEMPLSALRRDHVDYCVPLREMAAIIESILERNFANLEIMDAPKELRIESNIAALEGAPEEGVAQLGKTSSVTCPECGGALWEITYEQFLRYRCHVGHAYSAEDLMAEQAELGEKALSIALRKVEEQAATARRLMEQAQKDHNSAFEARLQAIEQSAKNKAEIIRQMLTKKSDVSQP